MIGSFNDMCPPHILCDECVEAYMKHAHTQSNIAHHIITAAE